MRAGWGYNGLLTIKKPESRGADYNFDHLLGTLGPLFCMNACTDAIECVQARKDVA